MAVVLTVVAFIAGSALVYSAGSMERNREKETRKRMEYIFDVLHKYVDHHRHLPCPARSNFPITDNNFGNGLGSGDVPMNKDNFDPGGYECQAVLPLERSDNSGTPGAHIMGGMVPFKTLNISPIYALDAWNRRMFYVVDHNLTWMGPIGSSGLPEPADNDGDGGFTDKTVEGDIVIRKKVGGGPGFIHSDNVAVLLLSFGRNGHGAWPAKGGNANRLSKGTADPDERKNGYDGNGVDDPGNNNFGYIFVQKFESTEAGPGIDYFDDIVEFRTKWQFDPKYDY